MEAFDKDLFLLKQFALFLVDKHMRLMKWGQKDILRRLAEIHAKTPLPPELYNPGKQNAPEGLIVDLFTDLYLELQEDSKTIGSWGKPENPVSFGETEERLDLSPELLSNLYASSESPDMQ